ncbi:MAG: hypothetical protein IR158_19080 [Cellulomonas sp.]|nr:hypothetical protein [Cellulomonas sp.]
MTPVTGRYERLDPAAVCATVDRLHARIATRFPDRNLRHVAAELAGLVSDVGEQEARTRRHEHVARVASLVAVVLVVGATVFALVMAVRDAVAAATSLRAFEWLPVVESAINDTVFAGIAVWFLLAVPARLQRAATLRRLHRLRSLAHVIDMHQLTKDPERLRPGFRTTSQSVDVGLDADGLAAYLDYCTELLSLVAKAAALCAEESTDAVVLDTVSTVENVTGGMSTKIWQKIATLDLPAVSRPATSPR